MYLSLCMYIKLYNMNTYNKQMYVYYIYTYIHVYIYVHPHQRVFCKIKDGSFIHCFAALPTGSCLATPTRSPQSRADFGTSAWKHPTADTRRENTSNMKVFGI